jgi:hypothetical protein
MRLRVLGTLLFFIVLSAPLRTVTGGPVRVGVFDVDVSPPIGSPLAYDPCDGVAMSLRASGIVLLTDDDPLVICAVDWIGIANSAHQQWRRAIAESVGTTPERVSLHTLHQHDAPFCDYSAESLLAARGLGGLLFDVVFARESMARIARAAHEARQRATPVTHIGEGQAIVHEVVSNRRILGEDGKVRATRYTACNDPALRAEPVGTVDPILKSISLWNEDTAVVVLTYFATHPQSYYRRGIANPDFPGMARFLRQVTLNGLPHIHFNGAGGNIGAGKYNDGSPDNRQVLATRMADAMSKAWRTTVRRPLAAGDVEWRTIHVALPPAPHLREAELLRILDDPASSAMARKAAATDLAWLRRCKNGEKLQVSCLRLGTTSVVHLPGEAVVEYQLYAQKLKPDHFIAVAAYGDYGPGYICLEEHYAQGGYEASPRASRVAPTTEAVLTTAIRNVIAPTDGH